MTTSKSQARGVAPFVCCMEKDVVPIVSCIKKTQEIAQSLATEMKDAGIICLYGDLGSGKTTFSKALISTFDIKDFSVKSPTYTYIRHYNGAEKNIYHIDLYRLEGVDELLNHEIQELLEDKKNLIVIEWADKIVEQLPSERIDINLEYLDKNTRKITINDRRTN